MRSGGMSRRWREGGRFSKRPLDSCNLRPYLATIQRGVGIRVSPVIMGVDIAEQYVYTARCA